VTPPSTSIEVDRSDIILFSNVSESVTVLAPAHLAILVPVPTPDNTDELSIFCHSPAVPISSFHITQSPVSQELGSTPVPFGAAVPAALHI